VCHCDHCQRQSGGAFSVNLVTAAENFSHNGTMKMFGDPGDDPSGTVHVERHFCGNCGSPIISIPTGRREIAIVKSGTLDDKSTVSPDVEVWCENKQSWVIMPELEVSKERE
jgi:hypothetical protein